MSASLEFPARATAAFNDRNLDDLLLLFTQDVEYSDPMSTMTGREATRAREQTIFDAFPDVKVEMSPFVRDEQRLAMTAVFRGTFTGPFEMGGMTLPPTGKPFEFRFAVFLTFEGEHVAREEVFFDRADLMQALGQA